MFIICDTAGYSRGNTYVMVNKITCWVPHDIGTKIVLSNGEQVLVSESPSQVAQMIADLSAVSKLS
jgi:uncharacterized protein YlzI (FlbEa/FlbD family)